MADESDYPVEKPLNKSKREVHNIYGGKKKSKGGQSSVLFSRKEEKRMITLRRKMTFMCRILSFQIFHSALVSKLKGNLGANDDVL